MVQGLRFAADQRLKVTGHRKFNETTRNLILRGYLGIIDASENQVLPRDSWVFYRIGIELGIFSEKTELARCYKSSTHRNTCSKTRCVHHIGPLLSPRLLHWHLKASSGA